jgi:hypothetical protein
MNYIGYCASHALKQIPINRGEYCPPAYIGGRGAVFSIMGDNHGI